MKVPNRNPGSLTRLAAALVLLGSVTASAGEATPRPNVLFIAVDDLKPALGCYGEGQVRSPNIDGLAARGTVFLNAHCQQAVCAPSRASLLMGRRPDALRVWDLKTKIRTLNPGAISLPQHFKAQGYETVGLGKIFDPRSIDSRAQGDAVSWSIPFTPSWEYAYSPSNGPPVAHYQSTRAHGLKSEAEAEGITAYGELSRYLAENGAWPPVEAEDVPDNAYEDGAMTDRAIERLTRLADGRQPFFLAVGYKKPHLPFVAPKRYWDLYERGALELAPFQEQAQNGPVVAYHNFPELRSYSGIPQQGPVPPAQQRELIHGYYACVSYVDTQIGRLLGALETVGEERNTVVVLWGDHGWHLGDHGLWAKHSNFEQATRAPLLFVAPGGKAGNTCSAPVEFVDVFPTLCDLAGLPVPSGLAGMSLGPIVTGTKTSVKPFAISQWPKAGVMGYALRTDRYRYVAWMEREGAMDIARDTSRVVARELYDYLEDPRETVNRVEDPGCRELVADLSAQLNGFLASQ